jgi:hypothetical protein
MSIRRWSGVTKCCCALLYLMPFGCSDIGEALIRMELEIDRSRLAAVERHFGNLYRFHLLEDGLYVEAHRTAAGEPSEREARSIFDLFWMESGTPRSGSDYVYLNLYDNEEDFAFQLYWDPSREDVVRSSTSHY